MIFTDLYKSPKSPLSRLRHPHHPILVPDSIDYDADLVSKDKSKQKEAVKRHLQTKVRNDWTFVWPPEKSQKSDSEPTSQLSRAQDEVVIETQTSDPEVDQKSSKEFEAALDSGEEPESDSDAHSVYSTVSDDPLHWRPRLEWSSELSDDELPYNSPSPFKFDTPDSIGQAVTASKVARKARRRREIRKETAWNDGLACFEARRNAWTGAKVAQIRPKPTSPLSPASPRRGLFWRTHSRTLSNTGQTPISPTSPSPISPSQSQADAAPFSPTEVDSETTTPNDNLSPKTSRSDSHHKGPEALLVETLLPVPPPLLPPANPMRASISPALYNSIYEKVVVNSLQPSCPINLSDMVRACVSGWKRDGEWPPRPAVPEPAAVVAVKRKKSSMSAIVSSNTAHMPAPGRKMSFSFLGGHGRSHDGDQKARRESAAGGEDGSGGSGTGPGKVIRRSLQKVLGIGHTMATAADGHIAVQDH